MNLTSTDDKAFTERLTGIVLDNLGDENFGVKELSREAGMNYYQINRRLKTISRKNLSQFIREIRLQKAMEMLLQGNTTASEAAYKVGFGSPSYFNTCFHEHFGFPPGEVKRKELHGKEESPESSEVFAPATSEVMAGPVPVGKSRRKFIVLGIPVVVALLAFAWFFFQKTKTEKQEISILVLPFKNFSDDPGNQYIADGIMEDILNNLYHISDMRVISRTTSEYFRDITLPANEIARKVKAGNVLEGSIREYGDKIRISVQLIDAVRDQHLWSQNFDRKQDDILDIQGDIATQIAGRLNAVLSDRDKEQITKVPTRNSEAYDNYLRGRFLLNKTNSESRTDIDKKSLFASLPYFEKAIAADSTFAEAYAGLAKAYLSLSGWGWIPPKEGWEKTKNLSVKALQIDPDCAEAHAVKGSCHIWGERRFEEGRKDLLAALQLNPNYPPVYQYYAQLLMITGPIEEARKCIDRALELEPYFWVIDNLNAWICYFEGKHENAIEACKIARDLNPDYIYNNWLFFLNYARLGKGEEAAAELENIVRKNPAGMAIAGEITEVLKKSGIPGLFNWLIDINLKRPIPSVGLSGHPFFVSWWYAILGNREQSLYWMEKNLEAPNKIWEFFNLSATNPDFDILRGDPRFMTIMDEIGLTPYNTRRAR